MFDGLFGRVLKAVIATNVSGVTRKARSVSHLGFPLLRSALLIAYGSQNIGRYLSYKTPGSDAVLSESGRRFADPATGKLELEAVLDGLLMDGLIDETNSALLRTLVQSDRSKKSSGPLERIAAGGWVNVLKTQKRKSI